MVHPGSWRIPRFPTWLPALIAAAIVVILLRLIDWMTGSEAVLEVMGFDPDRARLIAALVAAALIAAAAGFVSPGSAAGLVFGIGAFLVLFGQTFVSETSAALASRGAAGRFDPVGWLLTLLTLLVVATAVSWAALQLSAPIRRWVDAAVRVVRGEPGQRRDRRRLVRVIALTLGAVVLVVTLPVFGDIVNYAPDVRMRAGGSLPLGLAAGATVKLPPGLPSLPMDRFGQAGLIGPTAAYHSAAVLSNERPWLAWKPSGGGTDTAVTLPGPWTGGGSPTAKITIHLPPGYGTGGQRYPVVYEVPWGPGGWTNYVHLGQLMDELASSGQIPPEILVFVSESGGPYPDSECTNSTDGREWFERYVTQTVVGYVDSHFPTIANPSARALIGFSQGGFCAPMLLLRHPDVFRSAIAFSGYYLAGLESNQTPNAWRPFGGDKQLIAAESPLLIASSVPASLRTSLFVGLSGSPREPLYGPQFRAFAAVLHAAGIPVAIYPTPLGHAWSAVRQQTPTMLATLAQRMAALGVFGSPAT